MTEPAGTPETGRPRRAAAIVGAGMLAAAALLPGAAAQEAPATAPTRPKIQTNRWQEDWSVLADPALRTQPFDGLKYIPLWAGNPQTYLSFGATLRERFEINDAPGFGTGGTKGDGYLLQRLQIHADLHFNENWRFFVQLEDDRAFDKRSISPVDQDPLDLRLAFLEFTHPAGDGVVKARIGRQDFAFDLQRFVSSRDGPNVRQSFDAFWMNWENRPWRVLGFVSQPVQYHDGTPFDDRSNDDFLFSMIRVEHHVLGTDELSAYYASYDRQNAHYLDATGDEHRDVFDARFAGTEEGLDWDLEAMGQTGSVGSKSIAAWAVGSRAGYTFGDAPWRPRLGLQVDAASGDTHPGDGTLGTFNPLFPNGYYFSLGGYTGYSNLIHVKPSVTVKPIDGLSLTAAIGLLWRQTTADAVYTQPNVPVAGTAGQGDAWTGAYGQFRADYAFNVNLTGAVEAVHYQVGDALRQAGAHDSDYLGIELKFGW
jgi:hypothetical protein